MFALYNHPLALFPGAEVTISVDKSASAPAADIAAFPPPGILSTLWNANSLSVLNNAPSRSNIAESLQFQAETDMLSAAAVAAAAQAAAGLGYTTSGMHHHHHGVVNAVTPPYSSPPRHHSPLPSFGFTQEQVACVCEVCVFKLLIESEPLLAGNYLNKLDYMPPLGKRHLNTPTKV